MQDSWTIKTSTHPPTGFNKLQPFPPAIRGSSTLADRFAKAMAAFTSWRWIFFPPGNGRGQKNNAKQDKSGWWDVDDFFLRDAIFYCFEFKVKENSFFVVVTIYFCGIKSRHVACIFACFFFNSNFFATGSLFASRCALLLFFLRLPKWVGLVKQFGVPSSYLPKGGWSPISMGEYESVNIFLWLQGLHDIRGSLKKAGNSWAQWNVTNFFSEPRVRNGRPASSDCLRHAESGTKCSQHI